MELNGANDLDFYLNFDHAARRRVMFLAVGIGIVVGGAGQLMGLSLRLAVIASISAISIVEITGALKYSRPDRRRQRLIVKSPIRPHVMAGVFATVVMVVAAFLLYPRTEAQAFERNLYEAASDPGSQRNNQNARLALVDAKAARVTISSKVLVSAGNRFFAASGNDPEVWGTTMEFLAYRSYLNQADAPTLHRTYDCQAAYEGVLVLDFRHPAAKSLPFVSKIECVKGENLAPDKTARLEMMDVDYEYKSAPHVPESQRVHPPEPNTEIQFYRVSVGPGIVLSLGHMHMKNVIVEDTTVSYRGDDSLWLENVWFVNCRFELSQDPTARKFSKVVLNSGPVNFDERY
jgi:hypothetical protein